MKIGIASDMHFKPSLGYSDLISDGRKAEWNKHLDTIVEAFKDCDMVVLNGDSLNSKHNSAETLKEFVAFLERFEGKELVVLCGNHERFGDGSSALDFLKELKGKYSWHVITKPKTIPFHGLELAFIPYQHASELGGGSLDDCSKKLMDDIKKLGKCKAAFIHHAISGTAAVSGIPTDIFHEVVLPQAELEKQFDMIVGGHIHEPQNYGKVTIVGSSFSNELGDSHKRVLIIDTETNVITSKATGTLNIVKLNDPFDKEIRNDLIEAHGYGCIVKAVVTKRISVEEKRDLEDYLSKFAGGTVSYRIDTTREKTSADVLDMDIEALVVEWAKAKDINIEKAIKALSLIDL